MIDCVDAFAGTGFVAADVRLPVFADVVLGGVGTGAAAKHSFSGKMSNRQKNPKRLTRHTIGWTSKKMSFDLCIIQLNLRDHITRHKTSTTIFGLASVEAIGILITVDLHRTIENRSRTKRE